jgi:signal transduction histidine kinase
LLLAAPTFVLGALNRSPGSFLEGLSLLAMSLGMGTVGALVASRRTKNPIGWLLLAIGTCVAISSFAHEYGLYVLVTHPRSLPGGVWAAWLANWVTILALGPLLMFLPLLFPDGRLPSRRWRLHFWLSGVLIGVTALAFALMPGALALAGGPIDDLPGKNPVGIDALGGVLRGVATAGSPMVVALTILAAISLVMRFRRAGREERQQITWVAYGLTMLAGVVFLNALLDAVGLEATWFATASGITVFSTVPVTVGVAIFRYRLYDIDLVISKTVVAVSLAGFITAVYVGMVVGLGRVLGTQGEPDLGLSILATALVAVAFQPVRERVQRLANRLVYGKRATPYEVLASFAKSVAGTYPAEGLLDRMARTLCEGTGSARAEVWLKVGQELHRRAAWPKEPEGPARLFLRGGELPALPGATRAVRVHHQGEVLGALALAKPPGEPLTPAEEALLSDLAAQAGLVLRNVGLIEDLKASRQRIVAAQDLERRRIERDIHDGAQQRLVTLSLAVRMARRGIGSDAALAGGLDDASEELKQTLRELRDLARGVHPAILTEEGLGPAVESLAERSPVPVRVTRIPAERLAEPVEATAYFVVSEALTNAAKHAQASGVSVSVGRDDGKVIVEVVDDGIGGADAAGGTGLRGLADRVEAVGGRLLVESPPGRGTRLRVEVPCA